MRLIDANKLKAHYSWWKGGNREMTMDEAKSDFDIIIDLQPTIEVMTKSKYAALMGVHTTTPAFDPNAPLDADFVRTLRVLREGLAEPTKHGRWTCGCCSECGYVLTTTGLTPYCPNCGARMDGGENETY